ncbi:MAG: DHHA1 domain-containing protein, partial [Pseudomonadota bacterium]
EQGEEFSFVTNQTPFYAESGGQGGDAGTVTTESGALLTVRDVKKGAGQLHVHHAKVEQGTLTEGDVVTLTVDHDRRARIKRNHSATHLVHAALRRHLGDHVVQKGSYVGPDSFRFDFSHNGAVTREELDTIEAEVNRVIRQNDEGVVSLMPYDDAIDAGAMALFGEKYDDEVRVLRLGDDLENPSRPYSMELCGGTHVERTGDIALFVITAETAVASGIRRIEAVTGEAARAYLKAQASIATGLAGALKVKIGDVADRVAQLAEEKKRLEKELVAAKKKAAMGGGAKPASETIGDIIFTGQVLEGIPSKELRGLIADAKKANDNAVAMFISTDDGKASVSVGVAEALTDRIAAPELVKLAVEALGGKGGGGKPDLAHGGGPNPAAAEDAIAKVKERIQAI